jgi:N-acetylglutamate synthase-like GNAT family acetyltransferase
MFPQPIRYRRARRTDFAAISAILAASDLPALTPERAGLRRFRRLVADLGADLYVAEIATSVVGVVHVTYSRHVIGSPRARLELLVVAPETRRRGVGRGLAELATRRARRRGCAALRGTVAANTQAADFLARVGWRPVGQELEFDLADLAQ